MDASSRAGRSFRLRADPAPPADLAHKSHEEAVGRARTRDEGRSRGVAYRRRLALLTRWREGRVYGGGGRGRVYVGDSARPVFLTSWEMLSRSSAVLVRRLKVVRGTTEAFAARAGAGVANRVLQEAADGAVTVPRALLPAIVRRRRRARRGLARRGRHVVRIGMGLALMVQIDAINDRVVLVACAQ